MVRKNKDGSISVGILDDFAKDMNVPVTEDPPKEEPKATENKTAVKAKMPKKTAKKK